MVEHPVKDIIGCATLVSMDRGLFSSSVLLNANPVLVVMVLALSASVFILFVSGRAPFVAAWERSSLWRDLLLRSVCGFELPQCSYVQCET